MSLRLDLDYTTTSRKKKCLLILRGAVRVDYMTTDQKKVSIDFETTGKKKSVARI